MNVLLVDDEPDILAIVREFLEFEKHTVLTASNGQEALNIALSNPDLDVAFSDLKMPVMDGLAFLEKLRIHENELPVVLVSGQGDLESTIRALKLGALDFILKPVHLKSLADAIKKIETVLEARQDSNSAVRMVQDQRIVLSCDSQLGNVRKIISYLNKHTQDLCESFGLDDRKISICLQECLTNAIVHGNFGLQSDLKEEDWAHFDALIKQRQEEEHYSQKQVRVTFELKKDSIQFEIVDEGEGFDPSVLTDPSDPESWLKLSGRGILFIRSYMDTVSWNATGNGILMRKSLT